MTKDQEIRDVVLDRDDGACRLYRILTLQEKAMLTDQTLVRQLDLCSCILKSCISLDAVQPEQRCIAVQDVPQQVG